MCKVGGGGGVGGANCCGSPVSEWQFLGLCRYVRQKSSSVQVVFVAKAANVFWLVGMIPEADRLDGRRFGHHLLQRGSKAADDRHDCAG